ncbi:MAG: hypothetical protein Kow0091_01190 [Geminocystis sp.]|uniref:DUF6816 domain-containing protein n=2 Tax=Cyanobacterium TaxID=102234 RepID=K9Z3G8_CYAAP|nr:hypothetical protein Cyan10605_1629 [Cyanobacterium aponinum PCC 10605]
MFIILVLYHKIRHKINQKLIISNRKLLLMLKKFIYLLIVIISILVTNINPIFALSLEDRINQYPSWQQKILLPKPEKDLIFPDWFEGKWEVTSILKEQIAPLAPKFQTPGFEQNNEYIDKKIQFSVKFIESSFYPQQDNFVPQKINKQIIIIADRKFNSLSIAQAYLGIDNVEKVVINPNNTTEQITKFRGENELISTVIGRQQENISEKDFITSEVTRQFFRRPNSVYLNLVETTTKYHLINSNLIKAKQFTAIYLSPQDPDYFVAFDQPVALYYYTLELKK